MPFTKDDVGKYNKKAAEDDDKAAQWLEVANSAYDACMADDGTDEECAASAIQQANGVVKEETKKRIRLVLGQ